MMDAADCASFFTGDAVRLVLSKISTSLSEEDRESVIRAVCQMAQLMQLEGAEAPDMSDPHPDSGRLLMQK
ncbi:MAG: hypothetical protein SPL65_06965 [Lachnospiraceae bacterium]|nr:hypothetical protein [Lachnospiraceae bacterium]